MSGQYLHTGGCRCGAVRGVSKAAPFWTSYCHCRDCRKQTGAPVMVFVGFRKEDVTWLGEARTWVSENVTLSFCASCGSQISYRDARLDGEIYLSLGFMDDPERYPSTLHSFERSRLPFLHINDGLPRYDGFSIER